MVYFFSFVRARFLFVGTDFLRPIFFVGTDFLRPIFFSGPTFFVVILDVSGFKTVTIRSGVKNPI